jgi:hypothetical protein
MTDFLRRPYAAGDVLELDVQPSQSSDLALICRDRWRTERPAGWSWSFFEAGRMIACAGFAPVPNRWGARGWTTVRLDAITPPALEGALELAWRHAQPRGRRTQRRRETTG